MGFGLSLGIIPTNTCFLLFKLIFILCLDKYVKLSVLKIKNFFIIYFKI
jgi:hypothetical protein